MTRISPLVFIAIEVAAAITFGSSGRADDEPSPLTIEGYTDQLSYRAGEVVRFSVSTTVGRYSMEIDRLGAETKTVYRKFDLPGASHPIPEDASSNGCRWPVAHSLTVPADWQSGYYNVRLRVADNGGKFVGRNRRTAEFDLFFIVRPAQPGKTTPILLQLCTNTYEEFGGKHTVVGYECDGCEFELKDGLPIPTGRDGTPEGFVILGTCPARRHPADALWYDRFPRDPTGAPTQGAAVFGVYVKGGTVVATRSTDWAHGLKGGDPVVERITRNVLDRLAK